LLPPGPCAIDAARSRVHWVVIATPFDRHLAVKE
jgi:hypothetical protein